ncbi:MAG TPA: hypothetical protein VIK95_14185 [Egibacteraceae bacterium]
MSHKPDQRLGSFTVEIDCGPPDDPHRHEVTIGTAQRGRALAVYGAGAPALVRLQYTCPRTGRTRIMAFRPPRGVPRPFEIRELV